MIKKSNEILNHLESELEIISESDQADVSEKVTKSLKASQNALLILRRLINKEKLKSLADEVVYFKCIQPKVLSYIIYFTTLRQYYFKRTQSCSLKSSKSICKKYLKQIEQYCNEYQLFIRYYISGNNELDNSYFTRQLESSKNLIIDECLAFIDPDFTTGYDLILARSLAYDKLKLFFLNELQPLKNGNYIPYIGYSSETASTVKWTYPKNALVELLYSFKEAGCFNNGECDLNDIAQTLEKAFNIKLGNYYKTFKEICQREKPIQMLEKLNKSLSDKIDKSLD